MSDVTTVYLNPFRQGLGFRGSGFRAPQEREMPGASAKAWQSHDLDDGCGDVKGRVYRV